MSEATIFREGAFHFRVEGDLTFSTARSLLAQSQELFNPSQGISIDLSHTKRTDSAGLALLLEWMKRAQDHGVSLEVSGMPQALIAIAGLCNLEDLLLTVTTKTP